MATLGSFIVGALFAATMAMTVRAEGPLVMGAIPGEGIGLVAWDGTIDDLVVVAGDSGCRLESVWATVDGRFLGYTVGAPAFVNANFEARIGTTLRSSRVILLVCAERGAPARAATTPAGPSASAPPAATCAPGATPAPPYSTTPLYDSSGPDLSCGDFPTQADAQILFETAGGPEVDRHRLDPDGNGIACQDLP